MFPTSGVDVSMTAQIGDALLTLVKQDVQTETGESTARRRIEFFVLRAEALVTRLADRQEALVREWQTSTQTLTEAQQVATGSIADLEGRLVAVRSEIVDLQTGLLLLISTLTADVAQLRTDLAQTESTFAARLEAQHRESLQRVIAIEDRLFRARWHRFWAWVGSLWR